MKFDRSDLNDDPVTSNSFVSFILSIFLILFKTKSFKLNV